MTQVSSWQPQNLASVMAGLVAGTLEPDIPTVGRIEGGSALFYRGKVNGIAGDSGSGKTWAALFACAEVLNAGSSAVYVDLEDDARGTVERLRALGVDDQAIAARFVYINPEEDATPDDLEALAGLVAKVRPWLVVVDSVGEALGLAGLNPNADEQVRVWFARLPKKLARMSCALEPGPAVVVLDHLTKRDAKNGNAEYATGSQSKRAAISGAQYTLTQRQPFSRESAGYATLVCTKDRTGHHAKNATVAELHITPGPPMAVALSTPSGPRGPLPLDDLKDEIAAALKPGPLNRTALAAKVKGRRDRANAALKELVESGRVLLETIGQEHVYSLPLVSASQKDHPTPPVPGPQ